MRLTPNLQSHCNVSGTLFDCLELWAVWDDQWSSYRLNRVTLTYRPKTVWGTEDRRYAPKTLGIEFGEFSATIRRALNHISDLQRFCDSVPKNALVQKSFDPELTLSNRGFFLRSWPWNPIFDADVISQKAAAMAVLELLELEQELPSERL
jgi:hypothetical protein